VDDPRFSLMDLTLPAVRSMIAALVAGGVMTQPQADALSAMARGKISPAEQLCGLGTVLQPEDVGGLR
jgi:hypothetical protein